MDELGAGVGGLEEEGGIFFFCLDEDKNDKRDCWWRRAGEGGGAWDENRIILTLPFLTFIMLKGHSEHPASSSPVVL